MSLSDSFRAASFTPSVDRRYFLFLFAYSRHFSADGFLNVEIGREGKKGNLSGDDEEFLINLSSGDPIRQHAVSA